MEFQAGESAETIERFSQEPKLELGQLEGDLLCLAFARDIGRVTFSHRETEKLFHTMAKAVQKMSHDKKKCELT